AKDFQLNQGSGGQCNEDIYVTTLAADFRHPAGNMRVAGRLDHLHVRDETVSRHGPFFTECAAGWALRLAGFAHVETPVSCASDVAKSIWQNRRAAVEQQSLLCRERYPVRGAGSVPPFGELAEQRMAERINAVGRPWFIGPLH